MKTATDLKVAYFFPGLGENISTDILDIETLSNNIVVAPTIGNLVTYFSDERPVPYLAESWSQNGNQWTFKIRGGLACQDGELITAVAFAKSLARSIRLYSQLMEHPVFKYLVGYKELIASKSATFPGIVASGDSLIFNFDKPTTSGFLEYLTMSPFGYICSSNYDGDIWKDKSAIVSSGPYSLVTSNTPNDFTLRKREHWNVDRKPVFDTVVIKRASVDNFREYVGPKIIEIQDPQTADLNHFSHVKQIPQSLTILKANFKSDVFSNLGLRTIFYKEFRKNLDARTFNSNSSSKAERFFFNDNVSLKPYDLISASDVKPSRPIKLKVMRKGAETPNDVSLEIALKTAKQLGWEIVVDSEPYQSFAAEYNSDKFDIFIQTAEIGGGYEPWVIDMLFCSDVGNQWPDPSNRICKLKDRLEAGEISLREAAQNFQDYIIEDAAVLPAFHRGGFYMFGDEIDPSSLGPIVTRIRFEEIGLKK